MPSYHYSVANCRLDDMNCLVNQHHPGNNGMPREMPGKYRMRRGEAEEYLMLCQDCSPFYGMQ